MSKVKSYLSLIKFSHTIFAMPFALIGFFIGLNTIGLLHIEITYGVEQWNLNETIGWEKSAPIEKININSGLVDDLLKGKSLLLIISKYLGLVILCMIFARSAAMAFNRYLDRRFDAKNPRTAVRKYRQELFLPTTL